ncbi:hypothetical protein LY56_01317 [Roseinatronobacter thiooxidans]|uniref:O-antigen polysaccharide polymerase Wzy-like protein n=1 Tax=Roseinatronobacter thiooxidans TaxID=121821 RepID=A0A2W7QPG5_9RHOB|nr:hypothetical protein [Roseinatronobacter thiooxidans]PZX45757.1 hypothetical protein LY56_01317 [Roseinatronobacter thiooxidans]
MAFAEQHLSSLPRAPTRDRRAVRIARTVLTVLFGATAAVNLGAAATSTTPYTMTHLAAGVLALYLLLEVQLYLRRSDAFGLLSPVLLSLVFHFFLSYLGTFTLMGFYPNSVERFTYWLPDLDNALADTILIVGLAAFCMMRGYALARPAARSLLTLVGRIKQVRKEVRFNISLMFAIQIAFVALVAHAINIGAYGLLSTAQTRAASVDIQQFLNLGLAAGTLSYFLIMLRYFERRAARRARAIEGILMLILIALHVVVGALSAFKSQIVFPFLIAGFAYFIVNRRMPIYFFGFAAVALIMAYVVIDPFRAHLGLRGAPPASITEAVDAFSTAFSMREDLAHASDITRAEAIVSRLDLSGMTALAIDYVDRGSLSAEQRQKFQESILLAPILAYVPRAIWQDKPSYSPGVWFNQNVRGRWNDSSTSVAMGPIGYLYMAGGSFGVALGFLGFGMLQALIFEGIGRARAGGLIIYLGVAATLVMIPTSFGPAVTGVLRMLPIVFVVQWLLLSASRRSAG